ncbi:alpha-mannosidase [Pullulanibacillus camelliae]|uniref:Alpha-mannosidase n=1 Tax=Pullulanibacillus camelliae TaxID=1707096 RepID=A0A8J2YFL8_9BACL|nr:alpha-mannosidase [Pullulanibacillus camelliae]GGE33064.1 alpha-mannosidase [Pullulanibacillus camelliae]
MKTIHIISHSHWDREWYLPYEQHHMRLVQLMDDVLELFEQDPDFKSFHLDGQTIILEDYLQVRPEKREIIKQAIKDGKLRIGPFYILQDDFLISSEANTRNTLIGFSESKTWGKYEALGYFPDTFGNVGQVPQLLKESGLDVAVFGRGVKPTGFNNAVFDDANYTSTYSEMWWKGADGSKILGLLFANWYNNGNEIPVDKAAAKAYWDRKIADAERFASTDQLLMMNGCDHQPVQKDLSQAIKVANTLYPDITFIHSNFEEYIQAVKDQLPEDLSTVEGELTSQETDGWFTLANTASSRVYLKQKNTHVQTVLENVAEPLSAMAYDSKATYPHDQLRYAWKLLLQNHPHDSICGCSLDDVHREMMTRFAKAEEVGNFVADKALHDLVAQLNTMGFPKNSKPFVIVNTSGWKRSGIVEVKLEMKRRAFTEGSPSELFAALEAEALPDLRIINEAGDSVPAQIKGSDVAFGYELPADQFRMPYIARYVTLELFIEDMPAMSWLTYAAIPSSAVNEKQEIDRDIAGKDGRSLENEFLTVSVHQNGQLQVYDKVNHQSYDHLLTFEDTGDIGNEYIYKQAYQDQPILSSDAVAGVKLLKNGPFYGEILIHHQLEIPVSADASLEKEQMGVVDIRHRKAKRSKITGLLTLETKVRLEKGSRQVKLETTINNKMKDHRLRVLFPTGIKAITHESESIYEVACRNNKVSHVWENPTNPQHQHAFTNVHDDVHGLTVSNIGLNEYEVAQEGSEIAITLLRCVGEVGDWGYFPTPEAQCIGSQTVCYALDFHGDERDRLRSYQEAIQFKIPFTVCQTERHEGPLKAVAPFINISGEAFAVTALKRKEDAGDLLCRGYNLTSKVQPFAVNYPDKTAYLSNILEEKLKEGVPDKLTPAKIITVLWQ